MDEAVETESRLNASGSRRDVSVPFGGLDERNVLLIPPFNAKSKLEGMLCRESYISAFSVRASLVVDDCVRGW